MEGTSRCKPSFVQENLCAPAETQPQRVGSSCWLNKVSNGYVCAHLHLIRFCFLFIELLLPSLG